MNLRRSIAVAALAVAVPVLSSCGVNFGAPTDQVYNAAVGVDDRDGSVDVLNALVVAGDDGKGTVVAGLVNNDEGRADKLTGITAARPQDQDLTVTGPSGGETIPAGGMVSLAQEGKWTIDGKSVVPGRVVSITFTFEHGEPATLDVPVLSDTNPDYKDVPKPQR